MAAAAPNTTKTDISFKDFWVGGVGGIAEAVAKMTEAAGKYILANKQAEVAETDAKIAKNNGNIRKNDAMIEGERSRQELANAESKVKNQLYASYVANEKDSKAKESKKAKINQIFKDNKKAAEHFINLNDLKPGDKVSLAQIKSQVNKLKKEGYNSVPDNKKREAREMVTAYNSYENNLASLNKTKANSQKSYSIKFNDGLRPGYGENLRVDS